MYECFKKCVYVREARFYFTSFNVVFISNITERYTETQQVFIVIFLNNKNQKIMPKISVINVILF